ncbi:MAG: DUF3883 domain-containing protein [Deltaproteobacteria bacterium]|nr:DUF3883 domain-containing protein [Deltaproteobacteria bacterium]
MAKLEDLQPNAALRGVLPDRIVTVIASQWFGSDAVEITFKDPSGRLDQEILYRDREASLEIVEKGRPWSFDADGALFRLVSEAHRIRLAHLFDPVLAVHTSLVDPLPHQITAVYETMLRRQPLRFLLADDPGAGKTIMAGLLIKELIIRGDLQRCLVVCPGVLAEQWQDELSRRFHLPFDILTNDKLEAARTGNWFVENSLVIARLDKLSRDEDVQAKLKAPDCRWDLVICDEAHKMSATYFASEIKYTKRYILGRLLAGLTRHFLLMTATPHNGKDEDFQLFMALLDADRFEGHFRNGAPTADVSDLMRRMVKERLLKFDGTRLFPERHAHTVPFELSDNEMRLYDEVTEYVREEFNRADALQNDKRAGTVGFALTILQRRLASSPEAIFQSLHRRHERLEKQLRELEQMQRDAAVKALASGGPALSEDDIEDFDDLPDDEANEEEALVLDQATAARSVGELKAEIATLKRLRDLAGEVRRSAVDRKWQELAKVLDDQRFAEARGVRPKLVVFTEHRDTLNYLVQRISTLLGRPEAVVVIHGGMRREDRRQAEEEFKHNPDVQVLVATDAAGEGINLQRAHLMVNYDLPWNPNRIEQRFGRIHRIGQTEVCHLWNLVADKTREGDVYRRLLEKLERATDSLGGQVFDVLGKVQFEGKPLRDLMVEAIRYGERPEVRAQLFEVVESAIDHKRLQSLIDDQALAQDVMDTSRVARIREEMERAEARRLQPHFIESFFVHAFRQLGGTMHDRETGRFEITHVPSIIRNGDAREPVLLRYERIAFDKSSVQIPGKATAAFVCPGHPLLDATIDVTLSRHRDLLRRGAVLVDKDDLSLNPRVLFYLEHSLQDALVTRSGERRTISKRMLYVEIDAAGAATHIQYAPYLDYEPLRPDDPSVAEILARPECAWITRDVEAKAQGYAVARVVPEHLDEVRGQRLLLIRKTRAAVKERLTHEINHWDNRAADLKEKEAAGKPAARMNSIEARRRADEMQGRLERRLAELNREEQISALPPVVMGGALVVPAGLLAAVKGRTAASDAKGATKAVIDKQAVAARARAIVMAVERGLGFEPRDVETEKRGFDIESRDAKTGRLRFIEVKGRDSDAATVTVTSNEIRYSLNEPDNFILAIVEFLPVGDRRVHYVRCPFQRAPDFGATSVNYDLSELLAKAEAPR